MGRANFDRPKKAGWKVGTTAEFLGLTDKEAALIEMELALAHRLREHQDAQNLTHEQLDQESESDTDDESDDEPRTD